LQGAIGKLQKFAKKHSDVSKHKNKKENKERMKKGIDKNKRVSNNVVFSFVIIKYFLLIIL
jgi:hypothetical protein